MSTNVKQRCLGILTLTSGSWVSGSTEMLRAASRQWWDHGVDILSFTNVCKHPLVSDRCVLKVKWGNIWCCWPTSLCLIISPRGVTPTSRETNYNYNLWDICASHDLEIICVACCKCFRLHTVTDYKFAPAYWQGYLILHGEGMRDMAVVQRAPRARSSCSFLCPPWYLNLFPQSWNWRNLGRTVSMYSQSPLGCQLLSCRTF